MCLTLPALSLYCYRIVASLSQYCLGVIECFRAVSRDFIIRAQEYTPLSQLAGSAGTALLFCALFFEQQSVVVLAMSETELCTLLL